MVARLRKRESERPELFHKSNCNMYIFSRCQRMDDLVTAFLDALQERHSQGRLTQNEYQNVMRNLRYQLVEFVFTCITSDVTPRLEVTVSRYVSCVICNFVLDIVSCYCWIIQIILWLKSSFHRYISYSDFFDPVCVTCMLQNVSSIFIILLTFIIRDNLLNLQVL